MPVRFEPKPTIQDRSHVGISDAEIVQMVSAYRNFGFWRLDLDAGHFFASEDVYRIFDLPFSTGPMNLVETMGRVHEEDKQNMMETYELASLHKTGFHHAYRVKNGMGGYKMVRTVAEFRNIPGTSGDLIGITYEFAEQLNIIGFTEKDGLP
ncbi:diguanylate cyclase [Neorhizobium sp. P12A]|uniref:diguanylate cyclase n=1 Tax=Rhizobium/Agrobacterium group TaxID=227290 RepID=UPI00105064FC|nr:MULTISPECIES: diguanylate cyclase [Rhizobium/Agrobacterium group]KAA0701224.1 diguanylate cyclase [Neorhizobium sp. P12A]